MKQETIMEAAKRLDLKVDSLIGCADGVFRPIKYITGQGVRVSGSRELIDPRKLISAAAE